MVIKKNKSLKEYNTFGLDYKAGQFTEVKNEKELVDFIKSGGLADRPYLVLGGGSNILFTSDFDGLVIHPVMNQVEKTGESQGRVELTCDAGMCWDNFVEFCVRNNYGGLENLSYIPGNTGASPVQNIGAYGVEIKDYITKVRAISTETGDIRIFSNEECHFAYRDSIFKNELKNKYIISQVCFSLVNNPKEFKTSYGAVEDRLRKYKKTGLREIRNTIIDIRKEKLPEPEETGNAGSFFKNPLISREKLDKIVSSFPSIPHYPDQHGQFKIPAAWLIDQCGWKGYREGDAGVHNKQALVLVNYGSASGEEVLSLSEKIIDSVDNKFDIRLNREVNVI